MLPEDVNYLKGVAFTGMLATFTRLRGEEVAAQVVAGLNSDFRSLAEHGLIIKSSWLPVSWYRELLDSMIAHSPGGGVKVIRQAATDAVVHDMSRGVYRLLMKVLSPKWLIQNTPKVFRNYYKVGECKVVLSGERDSSGTIHFSACPGFSEAMWEDLIGGSIGVLMAAGAKNPREVGRRGGGNGQTFMDVVLGWHK